MRKYFYFIVFSIACFLSLFFFSCGNQLSPVESFIIGYTYDVKLDAGSIPTGISIYEGMSDGKTISQSALTTGNGAVIVAKPTNGSSRDSAVGRLDLRFTPSGTENTIKINVDGIANISGFKVAGKSYIEVPIDITNNSKLSVVSGSFAAAANLIQLGTITPTASGKINVIDDAGVSTTLTSTYIGLSGKSYDIKAVPNAGYSFSNMTIKETNLITLAVVTHPSTTDTFNVTLNGNNNIEVDATFAVASYSLIIPASTGGSVTMRVRGVLTPFTPGTAVPIAYGADVVLTATANSGYTFISFTSTDVIGTAVGRDYRFNMPAKNATVTANFT